jgi:DNA-binding response OmpR family regulator
MPSALIKFLDFGLDVTKYELRHGDRLVKIERMPMELLILLAERKGGLVTREEIIEKLWGKGVFHDTEQPAISCSGLFCWLVSSAGLEGRLPIIGLLSTPRT